MHKLLISVSEDNWLEFLPKFEILFNRLLQTAANELLPKDFSMEVSLSLMNNEQMLLLNKQYRGKDRPTNVLAFAQYDRLINICQQANLTSFPVPIGDVVLSWKIIREQAKALGKLFVDYCACLFTHGLLHLLGLDHGNDAQAEEMEKMEQIILSKTLQL